MQEAGFHPIRTHSNVHFDTEGNPLFADVIDLFPSGELFSTFYTPKREMITGGRFFLKKACIKSGYTDEAYKHVIDEVCVERKEKVKFFLDNLPQQLLNRGGRQAAIACDILQRLIKIEKISKVELYIQAYIKANPILTREILNLIDEDKFVMHGIRGLENIVEHIPGEEFAHLRLSRLDNLYVVIFELYQKAVQDKMLADCCNFITVFHPGKMPSDFSDRFSLLWDFQRQSSKGVVFEDRETPLAVSLNQLLVRNPYTDYKFKFFDEFLQLFKKVRTVRQVAIKLFESNMIANDYTLYSNGLIAASKIGGVFRVVNRELYEELISIPSKADLDSIVRRVIDREYVDEAILRGDIPESMRRKLEKWMGLSVLEASAKSFFGKFRRIHSLIAEEINSLPAEQRKFFEALRESLESGNYDVPNCELDTTVGWFKQGTIPFNVLRFLYDRKRFEMLEVTPENGPDYLEVVKFVDRALQVINLARKNKSCLWERTYLLREKIVEICPEMKSHEAFTRATRAKDKGEAPSSPRSWCSPRVGLHGKLVANTHVRALKLASELPGIIAGRGNTAAGKSTGFKAALKEERIEPELRSGILNCDPIKWGLRKDTLVRNSQIHQEGAMLFDRYFEVVKSKGYNYMLDLRLITKEAVLEYVLNPAKNCKIPAKIRDYDVPLLTSLNRLLTRDPLGEEPCPPIEVIIDGFVGTRTHRNGVVALIREEDYIGEYRLFYHGQEAARKIEGTFTITNSELYEQCVAIPDKEGIERDLSTVITPEYIDLAIANHDIRESQRPCLEQYLGKTIREAVNEHTS